MTKFNRFLVSVLFTSLLIAHPLAVQADMQQQGYGGYQPGVSTTFAPITRAYYPRPRTYGEKVGAKALNAFANITTSPLELPKNIINTINESNFFLGVAGGSLKGVVNMLGRAGCGIADLITFPLPTQPIVYPEYIWDDFDVDTTYGPVFRLDETQYAEQPAILGPAVTQPVPRAVPVPPKANVADNINQYNQETNRNLDRLYNKEMQK